MLKYSCSRRSLFSVIKTEFLKVPHYVSYVLGVQAKAHADSVSKTIEFLKGGNPNDDRVTAEKQKKHKEMYESILRMQTIKSQENRNKYNAELKKLSFKEKLKVRWRDLKQDMQEMTSKKAGVMALLQHCAASHAAEIAIEQDIDVKDVHFVLEKQQTPNSVTQESTVVGYIDAPAASEEEFAMFVEKLQKACPVANRMTIEWRNSFAFEKDGPMKMASHWSTVESAAPYPYNFREGMSPNRGENDLSIDKLSNHLKREGMDFKKNIDFEVGHVGTKKAESGASESENQVDTANHKAESGSSNQGEQRQTEPEGHVPHGTPDKHHMPSWRSDAKDELSSNSEQPPVTNKHKKH